MGWEVRHGGRTYLYRNRRVNGKPVKEYLAAKDRFGFGELAASDLASLQRREAEVRRLTRQRRAESRARVGTLLGAAAAANADLRAVADGLLVALGYRKHHRGEWRMRRELKSLRAALDALQARAAGPSPLVRYAAPADDAAAVELFAQARAGEAGALDRVHALIRERGWADWVGDLGKQATRQLVARAAGGDPVWEAGITQKVNALRRELLGERPSVLEELLVRRVVNGWVATHVLELELTLRPPLDPRDRAHLDAALTRAEAVRRGDPRAGPRPPAAGAGDPGATERRRGADRGQRARRRVTGRVPAAGYLLRCAKVGGGTRAATASIRGGDMPFANPDRARTYQREYRRTRRTGDRCTTPGTAPVPVVFRLQTAQDVIDLLEEQVALVCAEPDAGALEKARTVGFLAGVALKAIEAGNLAARIEMLERVLKGRAEEAK